MKKMFLISLALFLMVSLKLFADNSVPTDVAPEEEYYLCMWDSALGDCRSGSDNYCICIKE